MIRIDVDEVKSELNLTLFGAQGWLTDKDSGCPFCGRKGKWGVILNPHGGVCHCWYCNAKKSVYDYLKAVNRLDLILTTYQTTATSKLTELFPEEEEVTESLDVKKVELPRRLEPFINYPYLDDRGFLPYHYEEFEPSYTNFFLEKSLAGYIIFKLKMNGEIVAWLARSQFSYEWHQQELENARKTGRKPKLRYENSRTDFTKIVGGYDHITDNTETVILVEGLFDSVGIDNLLNTPEDESIRCCFLFGKSISREQIQLLKLKKSVKNIILMFDDGTEAQSKNAGLMLSKHFNTKIAHLTRPGVDPGDMDLDYLIYLLDHLEDPINFFVGKIEKRW